MLSKFRVASASEDVSPTSPSARRAARRQQGFTLAEVVITLAIGGIMVAGLITGYVQTSLRAEWSAHSLAAQALAMQRLEQTRAAKWDTLAYPAVDQVVGANFPVMIETLDVPISGTNTVQAAVFTMITPLTEDPPLRLIQVDCVWAFLNRGLFTNTLVTYRAPDQ